MIALQQSIDPLESTASFMPNEQYTDVVTFTQKATQGSQYFAGFEPKEEVAMPVDSRPIAKHKMRSESMPQTLEELSERQQGEPKRRVLISRKPLQQWYGNVVRLHRDSFDAQLKDPTGTEGDAEANIPTELLNDEDLKLLEVGSTFYWNVVLERYEGGLKEIRPTIRFQRLPLFNKADELLIARRKKQFESVL